MPIRKACYIDAQGSRGARSLVSEFEPSLILRGLPEDAIREKVMVA